MKSYNELLEYKSQSFDFRDVSRLSQYIKLNDLERFNLAAKDPSIYKESELTKESVLENLKSDLEFAFEKALDKRGLSSVAMYACIKMWCWVLNDEEHANWPDHGYTYYGLPLYKSVALKYGFPNEIGESEGDEQQYSDDYYDEDEDEN